MKRSRLKNIINKSKVISNKQEVGNPFDEFKKSLPIEIDDNYRLEAAWKAYGSPKDYKTALWNGMIQPIDETNVKLPSIGYNEETDEYEYLNKGEDNETVAKDIRVWDNDVIPLVQELKLGGYVRKFNKEKDCWTYTKNSQKEDTLDLELNNILKELSGELIEEFKSGGKKKIKIKTIWDDYIEVDSISDDQRAGRVPIGKRNGQDLYLNGDGMAAPLNHAPGKNENGGIIDSFLKGGKPSTTRRNIELLITYANNQKPPFILRILNNDERTIPLVMEDGKKHHGTHLLSYGEKDGKTYVFPEIQDFDGDLIRINWPSNLDIAIEKGDFLEMTPEEAKEFTKNYKKYYPNYKPFLENFNPQTFKQGGQMNVIPEGALHARKNNMEGAGEDFTAKGIPVIDNKGEQVAEIEKEEIIFCKRVTDKIEKAYKKYTDYEYSQKEKDEVAIEIGKFLCKEILENTDDKTGLILEVELKM